MTIDEFLIWEPGDPAVKYWQLIDGEPVAMAPAADRHGTIQATVGALLYNHLLSSRRPCRVVTAPGVIPRVRANENYRIPDLGVTCTQPSGSVPTPEPVLLVEILSPSNETETWANVWTYTTIPTVQEILIVRASRIEAALLRRQQDGSWPAEPAIIRGEAMLDLDSIGMAVPLASCYRGTGLTVG